MPDVLIFDLFDTLVDLRWEDLPPVDWGEGPKHSTVGFLHEVVQRVNGMSLPAFAAAVKAAEVTLFRIHVAMAIGGKGFLLLTGSVSAVQAAVGAAARVASDNGILVGTAEITLGGLYADEILDEDDLPLKIFFDVGTDESPLTSAP